LEGIKFNYLGRGSLEFEDGKKYTGSFKKGKIEGKGKLI